MSINPGTKSHLLCQCPDAVNTAGFRVIDDEHSEQQDVTPDRSVLSVGQEYHQPQSKTGSGYRQSTGTLAEDPGERLLSHDRDRDSIKAKPEPEKQAHTKLYRSTYIVVIVIFYAAVSLFAWVVTCILVFRPIALQHYDLWLDQDGMGRGKYYNSFWKYTAPDLYRKSETWFQTARVLQSIANILTIPVASAVCGSAAVVYAQRGKYANDLSLGQLVLLADKAWSDPLTILDLLFGKLAWKPYGPGIYHSKHSYASTLLVFAILLHLLGSIIAPLQQVLLGTKTLPVPTGPRLVVKLTDLPNQLDSVVDRGVEVVSPDSNDIVLRTRSALETAINTQPQAQLWPGAKFECDEQGLDLTYFCGRGTIFGDMSKLPDPFLAEIPSSFHTGLIRQFIPRINSTATYERIPESEFPRGCEKVFGAFYVDYQNTSFSAGKDKSWGLQACMPNNNTHQPWKFNRDRQDFTEQLYLNITLTGFNYDTGIYRVPETSYAKITLYTTAGYFELPNYMNQRVAGPLLDKDPFMSGACGRDCVNGTSDSYRFYPKSHGPLKRRENNNSYDPIELERIRNKGPLLTTAMALFGRGSFPQTRLANPQAYVVMPDPFAEGMPPRVREANRGCGYLLPLVALLDNPESNGHPSAGSTVRSPCIFNYEGDGGAGVSYEVGRWLVLFTNYTELERLSNAFTAAAFLANQNWLLNQAAGSPNLTVYYDEGMEIQAPVISTAGLIIVSVLLGLYLVALFTLAVYAAWTPRWTRTLDSFAMMRVGAAYGWYFPLNVGSGIHDVEEAHRLPGTVGVVGGDGGSVRQLEIGAKGRIGPGRYLRYRSRREIDMGD